MEIVSRDIGEFQPCIYGQRPGYRKIAAIARSSSPRNSEAARTLRSRYHVSAASASAAVPNLRPWHRNDLSRIQPSRSSLNFLFPSRFCAFMHNGVQAVQ